MLGIMQAIVLGLVQGLGEFLPISSTAHLVLAPYFFHWSDPGLAFDVALHFGTLIAVLAFFFFDWLDIFKAASNKYLKTKYALRNNIYSSDMLWLLALATLPGVLVGYFLENLAEKAFRHPLLIALFLSLAGLILYLADKHSKRVKKIGNLTWKEALAIGLSQAVAIIPGVSRSGATMTAGLFLGLDRISAARFSFLLSTPIILGATIFKFPTFLQNGINLETMLAIILAALSGYAAIKYLLKFIAEVGYKIFFWYRLILAGVIVAVYFINY
jgi:undecaprenyl-diphosphatase